MKDFKRFLKNKLCRHKNTTEEIGYGIINGLGIGSYSYDQCQDCYKIFSGVKNFKKDPEMYNSKDNEDYSSHGQGD